MNSFFLGASVKHIVRSRWLKCLTKNIQFLLLFFFVNSFIFSSNSFAQIAPVLTPNGGFHIDGNLPANFVTPDVGDWVSGAGGTGGFVINNNGSVLDPSMTFIRDDKFNSTADEIFTQGSKVNDDPNDWHWSNQSAPDKNDINRGLIHLSKDANDDIWLMMAGDRLSTNGDAYLDFELLQATMTRNTADNKFSSTGLDGGRTLKDLLITVKFNNGGGVDSITFFQWVFENNKYFYKAVPAPGPLGFAQTNSGSVDVPFGAFGTTTYAALQFAEAAVNISQVINISTGSNACDGLNIKTIFIKTKASTSVTAELKDFIDPIQVNLSVGDVTLDPVSTLCVSASPVTLVGTPAGGTYSGPGVTGNIFYPAVAGAGTHRIIYSKELKPGCTKSDTIYIQVDAASVGGSVTASATVCSGTNSGTLTLSGKVGTVVKWQKSTDGGANWTDIANTTTSQGYTNLTQTTTYRAVVQSGVCAPANSSPATITVNPVSVGGSVTSSATVCSGSNSGTLTLSGQVGTVVKWQKSTDGGANWTDIANTTTSQGYTNLTQTTSYRAVVQSGVCAAVNSTPATITVNVVSVGGSVTSSATVCSGSNSGTLTLSGQVGTVVKWQKSTDGGANWTDIANTTTSQGYTNLTQTTSYRAVVQSGVCAAVNSTPATITVNPVSVGGSVTASATVCSGSNSGTLTLSGQVGTVVKWQKSTDGGTNWTDIANTTTSQGYTNLTQTTSYRAVVQSGVCAAVNSTPATITVNVVSVGGSVTASATVCSGSNSGTLTLSGQVGAVVKWQKSTDGGANWTDIANTTTSQNYTNLTQTTSYRAVVQSGVCAAVNSTPATITVDTPAVGGTVTGVTLLCDTDPTGTLTLVGYVGSIVKWQSSTDGINWTDIANTTSTLNFGILTQRTYFRAVVQKGICAPVNSTPAAVLIIACGPVGNHCTYTQGFYGNLGGKGCSGGDPAGNTLENSQYKMLKAFDFYGQTKVVFGRTNIGGVLNQDRAFTLFKAEVANGKIYTMMPGGGTPAALGIKPGGFAYADTYEGATYSDPTTWSAVPFSTSGPTKGKIKNVLLAQTMALFFNIYNGTNLEGYGLHDTLWVKNFDCLTGNAIEGAPSLQFGFPHNVITYLGNNGGVYTKDVAGLYKLANDILGGVVISGITASDVNNAVDKVNNTFDGCRSVIGYYDIPVNTVARGVNSTLSTRVMDPALAVTKLTVSAYPNPYTDKVRFSIESPVTGKGSLEVYNMVGQKLQTVYEGNVFAGKSQYVEYNVPVNSRGNLIYILKVGDQRVSGKLINPKK